MGRKQLWLAIQLAATIVLLYVLWRRFDWPAFVALFSRLSLGFYVGSLAAVTAGQLLYALRWRVILAGLGVRVSYADVVRQHLIGLCFSNVLPSGVGGDAAKVFLLGRSAGYMEVTASVFVDRFLGFFWLAIGGAVLAWMTIPIANHAVYLLDRNLLTVFAAAFIAMIVVVLTVPIDRWVGQWVPSRWGAVSRGLVEGLRMVRRAVEPMAMAVSGVITLGYAWMLAELYRAYCATAGLPVASVAAMALVVVSVAIFINVPLSINGIGLREQLHVLLLGGLGIPAEAAVLISLLLFAHLLVLSLVGLGFWLRLRAPIEART